MFLVLDYICSMSHIGYVLDYICSLSHIGYVYMLPVILAYINRPLLYIILCDSIYNIAFNMVSEHRF
jgi:hypothetical protein